MVDESRSPRLDAIHLPRQVRAVVLVLHGGQEQSTEPVRNRNASWWRMLLMARALRPAARRHGLAVHLLQHRYRGWNDDRSPAPVEDARWAFDRLRTEHGDLPVVLVGHSMGGRTACRSADDSSVVGVVGLAPWLPQDEPTEAMRDRALHVLHGPGDRWTSAPLSEAFVERCRPIATQASWTPLPGAGHFMVRHLRAWNRFVEDSVLQILGPGAEDRGTDETSRGPA